MEEVILAKLKSGNTCLQIVNKWKQYPCFRLFVYILLTSLALYWQFIFGDKVFVFFDSVGGDQHHSYIPAYNFFANALREGELTSYTFQYGFGNSIFFQNPFLSDPFAMIGIIVGIIWGSKFIAESMIYILILKHVCAGLLCFVYLKHFNFSVKSSIITAYIYAFAGYMMTMGEHYFFANNPIYFILILFMLENVINGEYKIIYWCGLLYVSVLVAFAGLTTVYEIFLAAGVYTLFRVVYIYEKDIKQIVQRLGISLVFVLGGIGIASFNLLPVLDRIMGSSRLVHSVNPFSFYDFAVIKSSILKLFSNNLEGLPGEWYGGTGEYAYYSNCFSCFFSIFLVPIIAQFLWITFNGKISIKKKIFRVIPIAIVVLAIFNQFIPLMFSFFVPHYHTYTYVFYPLYALIFAEVLDNVQNGKFSRLTNLITMIISLAIIIGCGISTYNKGCEPLLFVTMLLTVILLFGCFVLDVLYLSSNQLSKEQLVKRIASFALCFIIVLNLFCENYTILYWGRVPLTKEQEHQDMLMSIVADNLNNSEKDNFFRIETLYHDGIMMGYTFPFLFPIRATASYDSSIDNGIPEFLEKMFNCSVGYHICYQDFNSKANNTITEDILGLKYLVLTSDNKRNGWKKIEEYPEQGVALYQNLGVYSAALLFDSYITKAEADEMSIGDRAIGMATRLIIDEPAEDIDGFALKYSKETDMNDNMDGSNKNIAINIGSVQSYDGTLKDVFKTADGYNIKAKLNSDGSNLNFAINTEILNNSRTSAQVTFRLKDNAVLKNFVYCDGADYVWKEISILEPKIDGDEKVYTFIIPQTATALALCVNQSCELDVNISTKTVTATYVNEGIQLDNPKRGSTITGTVTAQKNSLLYLPIPFNKYWNAYIDGEKVNIMKANYAFMAVPLTAGEHTVEFIYSNEMFNIFLKVSIATFILYNSFFVFCFIVKYRRKKS